MFAEIGKQNLHSVNCHLHTETSDFLGGLRPVRSHSEVNVQAFNSKIQKGKSLIGIYNKKVLLCERKRHTAAPHICPVPVWWGWGSAPILACVVPLPFVGEGYPYPGWGTSDRTRGYPLCGRTDICENISFPHPS